MSESRVALILAGGRGKRMDILCHLRPKPALPFAGTFRVIDFTSSNCVHSQIADIGVLIDYQRAGMAEYLRQWHSANGGATNLCVLPPRVGSYAGTADAVYQNLDYLEKQGSDTVLILAGDHIYKMDYHKMITFHHMMKADATVGVVRVPIEETHRFGTVTVDAQNRITEFVEKSPMSQSNLASMGIYVFNKDLLARRLSEDARELGSRHDFGYSILPRMVKADRVFAYEFNGYWHDIGTVEAYYEANMELLRPQPRFSLDSDWPILSDRGILPVRRASGEGSIVNSLVGPGCVIKGYVENSVLSPGTYVAEKAIVRNSVVMAQASIGNSSVVEGCILDEGVTIGEFSHIGVGTTPLAAKGDVTVLGKEVTVPSHTVITRNCRILPHTGSVDFVTNVIPGCYHFAARYAPQSTVLAEV